MKQLTHIFVLVLFLSSSTFCRAEREEVPHVFQTMRQPEELEFADGNKTAITPLLTYTCATGSEFMSYSSNICAGLAKTSGTITTTQVKELVGFSFNHFPSGSQCLKTKVYVSKDGVDYGKALSGDSIVYKTGTIEVTIPRGNYYVKIVNTDGSNMFYIRSVRYYMDHCNCFEYVP